jgi:hypothetical protein
MNKSFIDDLFKNGKYDGILKWLFHLSIFAEVPAVDDYKKS